MSINVNVYTQRLVELASRFNDNAIESH